MGDEENAVAPVTLARGPLQRFMYGLGKLTFKTAFTVLWRTRVVNVHLVPAAGGVLFAANHASFADPPLVGIGLSRPVYYMGKAELFRVPLLGWALRQVNAFPVKRKQSDVAAFRLARDILKAGGALVVFPEGKRQKGGRFGPVKAGVGLLAKRAGVDVVPVYLHNTWRLARLAPFSVIYGAPMRATPGETPETFSQRVLDAIRAIKEAHFGPEP